ncbi:MAG TPA: cyanophycin synthetase, partial [Solirubrobacteraceae bacterium]|nr:cyanophycin synthetase [Solirubrobacteraceae bacterium]
VAAAAAATAVPGRLQVLDDDPLTILDGAHNPHAVDSLLCSLPEEIGGRPLGLVLGVLEDKDAAAMLEGLLARAGRAWFVAPPGPRALPPATLHSLARQLGFTAAESGLPVGEALEQAREWARERDGAVLVTGSVYLVGEVLAEGLRA